MAVVVVLSTLQMGTPTGLMLAVIGLFSLVWSVPQVLSYEVEGIDGLWLKVFRIVWFLAWLPGMMILAAVLMPLVSE